MVKIVTTWTVNTRIFINTNTNLDAAICPYSLGFYPIAERTTGQIPNISAENLPKHVLSRFTMKASASCVITASDIMKNKVDPSPQEYWPSYDTSQSYGV